MPCHSKPETLQKPYMLFGALLERGIQCVGESRDILMWYRDIL